MQLHEDMRQATTCITDRQCPICFGALGDDSDGTVCRLVCGGGTHYFHAECIGTAWWTSHRTQCPLCRTDNAGTPEEAFVWTATDVGERGGSVAGGPGGSGCTGAGDVGWSAGSDAER